MIVLLSRKKSKVDSKKATERSGSGVENTVKDLVSKMRAEAEVAKEMYALMESGKLKKVLRFLALEGPSNIYNFSRKTHLAYSVAHGLLKRLERLGLVENIENRRNVKGVISKFYGLSMKGLTQTFGYCRLDEVDKVVKLWLRSDTSGVLEKWDYLVHKFGKESAFWIIYNYARDSLSLQNYISDTLDSFKVGEANDEAFKSQWISFLKDDEKLRRDALKIIEGRIWLINHDMEGLLLEKEFLENLRRDVESQSPLA